ncbi:MAG: hypothetical protein LBN27_07880 [Prevotellaceae bacterium]|jgi:hypothetical protein|nr:hypothetical protein [Prevotellaceae bacterium]
MLYNNTYNVNFRTLAVNLLPTMLRKERLIAFLLPIVGQIGLAHVELMKYRRQKDFRLTHNGQRCYLRGALNEIFDPILRRITIGEGGTATASIIWWREEEKPLLLPALINQRGYVAGVDDFTVEIPAELEPQKAQIAAVTAEYKLASKQFSITII